MRVLARLHAFPPAHNAGAETMALTLLSALAERGHDVQVWLSTYDGRRSPYEIDGVTVIPEAARWDLGKAVRTAGAVVSHLEGVRQAGSMARGWGRPYIVLCHNTFEATWRNMCSGTTALAVYNSQWMRAAAQEWFAANPTAPKPGREIVVRPLVDPDTYRTTPGDCITLINLYEPKGGALFWRLAEAMPNQKFLAVKGSYGDQVVRDLPNVEVLENIPADEMRDRVYARTRVLLMPSTYESWGRAGVEAMASGIPVVAHPTPGLKESLAKAGTFVDRDDLDAWVAALNGLQDPARWRAASKRALRRSAELDPAGDLETWCDAVEALA